MFIIAYDDLQLSQDGTPTRRSFQHLPSEIGAEEAEEIGVEHLLRDIKDTTVSTLAERVHAKLASLKGLKARLEDIQHYLEAVAAGKMPVNHEVSFLLQETFNLLPNLNVQELVQAFSVKTNDMMLVIYISSLIRSVIALHNLINNKLALKDAENESEKKEGDKKDSEKKVSTVFHSLAAQIYLCAHHFALCRMETKRTETKRTGTKRTRRVTRRTKKGTRKRRPFRRRLRNKLASLKYLQNSYRPSEHCNLAFSSAFNGLLVIHVEIQR